MKMDVFIEKLKLALTERGIPMEAASKHAEALLQSFDSDDLSEIEAMDSSDEIEALASSIAALLKRKKTGQSAQPVQSAQPEQNSPAPTDEVRPLPPAIVPNEPEHTAEEAPQVDDELFEFDAEERATTKGMATFWCGLFLTLPITLPVLSALLSALGGVYIALFGLIAGLLIGMVALIAAGSVTSLVGIIYGITQLFSFVEAGIYEIGLGIIVAGAVVLVSVLIFNFAIRFLPFVMKKYTVFFKFVLRKLKGAFFALRRECYKL